MNRQTAEFLKQVDNSQGGLSACRAAIKQVRELNKPDEDLGPGGADRGQSKAKPWENLYKVESEGAR